MLEDKTYKVKVGDHHDAVIFVYERHRKCLNPDVKVTVDALSELYSSCPDYEMGIEYTMNTHQYINV